MLLFLFLGASAAIVILIVLILAPYAAKNKQAPPISFFLVVLTASTVSVFFSSLQRLYDFKQLPQIRYDKRLGSRYDSLFVYSLVQQLVGAIVAAVLYLSFAGGMLSDAFVSAFACKQHECADYGPVLAVYYAKAILWGFLAGFAEHMVSNRLNRFAQDAGKDDGALERDRAGPDRSQGNRKTGAISRVALLWRMLLTARDGLAPATASRGLANQN
jgi:hypothetical protein